MVEVLHALGVKLRGLHTQQIRCPVHTDSSPSARYYAEDQRVHCFVCGKGWDAFGVVQAKFAFSYDATVAWIASNFGQLPLDPSTQVRQTLETHLDSGLRREAATVRRIDSEVRQKAATPAQALSWWLALDILYGDLADPVKRDGVPAKLAAFRRNTGL